MALYTPQKKYKRKKYLPIGRVILAVILGLMFIPIVIIASYPQSELRDACLFTSVGLAFVIGGLAMAFITTISYFLQYHGCTQKVTGRVVEYETIAVGNENTSDDGGHHGHHSDIGCLYRPIYEYLVDGRFYRQPTDAVEKPPAIGDIETIYYSKKRPDRINREYRKPEISLVELLLGAVCIVIGVFIIKNSIYPILVYLFNKVKPVIY